MRKKLISMVIVGTVLLPLNTQAIAADGQKGNKAVVPYSDSLKSLEEQYEFLKEKQIFMGKLDGKAHFQDNMTRAELAAVLSRMYHLEKPKSKFPVFSDVKQNYWAKNAIVAVTSAGYMHSKDGKFEPGNTVTLEQLVATVVRVMGIDLSKYENESKKLPGSKWAQIYLAAARSENVLIDSNDYTKVATRSDFISTIYLLYKNQFKYGLVYGALEPSLSYEKSENGQFEFTFKVKNQTGRPQVLTLSGQEFDYILYKDGEKVEQYSDGKNFILMLKEITLKQGEEFEMKTTLDYLEKGEYKIEFWLVDKNWPNAKAEMLFLVE